MIGPPPLLEPSTATDAADRSFTETAARMARQRLAIDRSTSLPVLVYFASSIFWLLAGTVFAMISSIKMHAVWFLSSWEWLTFGRVRPVHQNIVAYGWASMAGIGTAIWLMARLSRSELLHAKWLVGSAVLWNLGVLLGTIAVLSGYNHGIEYLEFPAFVPPILASALILVSVWSLVVFHNRREPHVYVSQWYLFAAMIWFPWIYTAVNLLLVIYPIAGVAQGSITWWYGHNILGVWFTPIGLATIYYVLPKILGRPIYSYYLGVIGFWSLALFYNWNGAHHLIGGPLPEWLITVSIVASVMMVIPVGAVGINHHMTMRKHFKALKFSPSLRFIVFGGFAYTAVSLEGVLEAFRDVNLPTHFTHFVIAHAHLGLYGFYTMTMFGAMYYIMPRLTGWEWGSPRLISLHFWFCAIGILLMVVPLSYGGLLQGWSMLNPKIPFIDVVRRTANWMIIRSISGVLLTIGHILFTILFVRNLLHWGERRTSPTLLNPDREEYARTLAGAERLRAAGEAAGEIDGGSAR